jgi:hypothetical protein
MIYGGELNKKKSKALPCFTSVAAVEIFNTNILKPHASI